MMKFFFIVDSNHTPHWNAAFKKGSVTQNFDDRGQAGHWDIVLEKRDPMACW